MVRRYYKCTSLFSFTRIEHQSEVETITDTIMQSWFPTVGEEQSESFKKLIRVEHPHNLMKYQLINQSIQEKQGQCFSPPSFKLLVDI